MEALELLMDEYYGFWFVAVIVACMAWIWRKLKDIETYLKERDLVQQKHNEKIPEYLNGISREVVNLEWERKFKAEQELKKKQ